MSDAEGRQERREGRGEGLSLLKHNKWESGCSSGEMRDANEGGGGPVFRFTGHSRITSIMKNASGVEKGLG